MSGNDDGSNIQKLRISTQDLPQRDYIPAVRDVLGRDLMGSDLRPANGDVAALDGFRYEATVSLLGPDAAYIHSEHTSMQIRRTTAMMSDGIDHVFLSTATGGSILGHAKGEIAVPHGGIVLMSKARAFTGTTPGHATTTGLQVPRAALALLLPHLEEAPMLVFNPGAPGADSAALALSYAALVARQGALDGPSLARASSHLLELIACAFDARHAASPAAQEMPLLALIQQSIRARLDWAGLDLAFVARLHHTTPRQIQRLFASQGTCFSDFLTEERMRHARALLADPRERHRRVLDIALDCGFDNLSAFGRAFRRRFGMTPTEARQFGGLEI